MKGLGAVRVPDFAFDAPDYSIRLALSTAGAAIDLPAAPNHPNVMRITALTSAASPAALFPFLSIGSTGAAVPTTGVSSGSSAYIRATNERLYNVGGSTHISLLCEDSCGYASIELWK